MSKYVTLGTVSGVLAIAAVLAGAFGKPALQAFLSDPSTAQTVLTGLGAVLTLVAGVSQGIKKG